MKRLGQVFEYAGKSGRLVCRDCGAVEDLRMPLPITEFNQRCRAFEERHGKCPEVEDFLGLEGKAALWPHLIETLEWYAGNRSPAERVMDGGQRAQAALLRVRKGVV